jgi:hypothetical protein
VRGVLGHRRWLGSLAAVPRVLLHRRRPPARGGATGQIAVVAVDIQSAASALATGSLTFIVKAYRTATGTSQAGLAVALGYDTSYISMIENGRRAISDVPTLRRFARYLGVPPHVLGVTDPQDADFAVMIQFGESTIRLASVAARPTTARRRSTKCGR